MLGERPLTPARARSLLADLRRRPPNYDPTHVDGSRGWHVDDLRQPLAGEPPGPPRAGGTWETARRLMRHYDFADPPIVRAFYDEGEPLEGRTMLLELRFWRWRFPVGVRVDAVYEDARQVGGRRARVTGWTYRTLEGHLEVGEMAWEVWKWEDTGAVEFRIHAQSRAAPTDSVLVRLGLRLFGRREQLRFYRRACARAVTLTSPPARGTRPASPRRGARRGGPWRRRR